MNPNYTPKYRPGDKVTITQDLKSTYSGTWVGVVSSMFRYQGRDTEVLSYNPNNSSYRLAVDDSKWNWPDATLEFQDPDNVTFEL